MRSPTARATPRGTLFLRTEKMGKTAKLIIGSTVEWALLLGLWMAFVSNPTKDEFLIGVAAAFVGAVADALVKREKFFKFEPKASWILYGLTLPWYATQGFLLTMKAFFMRLFGKHPDTRFRTYGYDATGDDSRAAAKRALATAYLTIPPNSIIVGIDREQGRVLTHQIISTAPNMLEEKLGVES